MDIWALCGTCRRWFHCPTWFDRSQPQPRCHACDADPIAIENRAAGRVRAEGAGRAAGPPPATGSAWAESQAG